MTLALAGIVQAASLVSQLAQTGKLDETAWEATIRSIFVTDPENTLAVYGGLPGIQYGLEKLVLLLTPPTRPTETRFMLAIMRLQKKISRSAKMTEALTKRITKTKKQAEYFSPTHPTVIASLADIYETTLNALHFRTAVWGNHRALAVQSHMEKIRALLLAGVRSSVLWRQMGGSRLSLIFMRAKIRGTAQHILASFPHDAIP
jgi:high frequency lysogenization protein